MRSAFILLALLIGVHTFAILKKLNSKNHQEITRMAILRATAKVCGFKKPDPLDVNTLVKACKKESFKDNFETGIIMISYYNVNTDQRHALSAKHHFDSETFVDGKALIINGTQNIINSTKSNKFDDARKTLGGILHTLQDFYSHSNWIELGNKEPCTALINPDEPIPNPAGNKTKTCDECPEKTKCGAKILKEIIDNKILTSGYFGITKPKGKCSHGGFWDFTTGIGRSWDGINKDYSNSSHGDQHNNAAEVAIDASVQLLENIWKSIDTKGGDNFLRLMGLHTETPKGEWKTHISFFSFISRYPDANNDSYVDI